MLFLSTPYRPAKSISDILEELVQTPVRNVELSGGTDDGAGVDRPLRRMRQEHGFNYQLHNYFPPPPTHFILNIAAVDETERRRSVDFSRRAIALVAGLGLDRYTVHSGYRRRLFPGEDGGNFKPGGPELSDRNKAYSSFERSVDELCACARENGILLGIENMFPAVENSDDSLMCRPEELEWSLERFVGYPNFGILLDLAHLNISAQLLGFDRDAFLARFISRHRSRLLAVHLSHNDGVQDDHRLPPPDSWQIDFLRECDNTALPVTLEARNQPLGDIIDCYASLKELSEC